MFVKFNASGAGMLSYVVWFWIIRLSILALYILNAFIPYWKEFIELLQNSLNTGKLDLLSLLTPIFWIIVYYIAKEAIIAFITFAIIMPAAKRRHNW